MVIRYMLDTNACIALIKARLDSMFARLSGLSVGEVAISIIVAAELWYGVVRYKKKKQNEAALRNFLDYVTVLDWPCEACSIYGQVRTTLEEKGTPIGAMDVLIASHSLSFPMA
jgi:tRNA(fMet)-specific endonuclease VapC